VKEGGGWRLDGLCDRQSATLLQIGCSVVRCYYRLHCGRMAVTAGVKAVNLVIRAVGSRRLYGVKILGFEVV
jgi:hypothetical protein